MRPTLPANQPLSAIESLPPHLLLDLAAMGLQDIIAYLHPAESSRNVMRLPESPRDSSPDLELDQWLWPDTDTLCLSSPSTGLLELPSSSSLPEPTSSSRSLAQLATIRPGTCMSPSTTHTSRSTSHSSYQTLPGYEAMEHQGTSSHPKPTSNPKRISKSHVNSGKTHSFETRKSSWWNEIYNHIQELRLIEDQAYWIVSELVYACLEMTQWGMIFLGTFLCFAVIIKIYRTIKMSYEAVAIENERVMHHQDQVALQMRNEFMTIDYAPSTTQPRRNAGRLMIKNKTE